MPHSLAIANKIDHCLDMSTDGPSDGFTPIVLYHQVAEALQQHWHLRHFW